MAKTKVAILITGSRSLNPAGKEWAIGHIKAALAPNEEMDISVLNGGADGPDRWATEIGLGQGLYVAEWRTDGIRYAGVGMQSIGRWKAPAGSEGKPTPLQRNLAMIEALLAAKKAGYTVGVLALVDPKSPTHGTDHTVSAAKAAGIDVDRREFVTVPTAGEIAVAAKKKEAEENMRKAAMAAVGKPPKPSSEREEEIMGAIAADCAGADGAREHLDQLLSDAEFVAEREALDEEVHTGGIPAYSPPQNPPAPPQDHLVQAHIAAGLDPVKFGLPPAAKPSMDPADVEFDRALEAGIAATANADVFSSPKAVVHLDDTGVHGAVFDRTPRGMDTVSAVYTLMRQHSRAIIEPFTEGPKHYGFRARFNPMLVPRPERVDLFKRVVEVLGSRDYEVTSSDWIGKGEPGEPEKIALPAVQPPKTLTELGPVGPAPTAPAAPAASTPAAPAPAAGKAETIKQATTRLGPFVLAFLGDRVEGGRHDFLMDELRDWLKKEMEGNPLPTPDAYKILYELQKQKALEYEVIDRKKSLYSLTQFNGTVLAKKPPAQQPASEQPPAEQPAAHVIPDRAVVVRTVLSAGDEIVVRAKGSETDPQDDDCVKLTLRLGELLTGVADGIKGPPADLVAHDWSNLPTLARELRAENDRLRASLANIRDAAAAEYVAAISAESR